MSKLTGKQVLGMATAAAALASIAGLAQGQCQTATGPDVIVGDSQDIQNHTNTGTQDSISLGSVSCNVGTQNLLWIASDNRHPVIGGTLYRYRETDGHARLEQIGQSWLKHGFTALTQNLCCTCSGQGGSVLGVGCSDPYTAARNGSQSGLGPKWQVNASTGIFTYPPANPSWSGTQARRLQFPTTGLTASNTLPIGGGSAVRYISEVQYVAQDDAAAGNKFNNTSYRTNTVSLSGSNMTFSFSAATVRQKAAIEWWATVDNQVLQTTVIVPNGATGPAGGEGKFIVSSRAYDLGGGIWHYEYAIYNQCSHRSGGMFEVPVPSGVTVSDLGFNSVPYYNGDGEGNVNRSNAPWTTDTTGNKVQWYTQTMAENVNANAIRWGTMYNFRFRANTPPDEGNATIGLWRPAVGIEPTNVTARVKLPSMPTGTPCPADWDGSTEVDVGDIFAFLADWFANDPDAYNFGGTPGVPAIFAYLSEWFAHGVGPC